LDLKILVKTTAFACLVLLLLDAVDEHWSLPVASRVQLTSNFLGDWNIRGSWKSRRPQKNAIVDRFVVWLVWEFHLVGSIDTVLARNAVASGASCSGGHGNFRTSLFRLRLYFLRRILSSLLFSLGKKGYCRGNEVQESELAFAVIVVLNVRRGFFLILLGFEFATFAIQAFTIRRITVFAYHILTISENGKAGLGALFEIVLLVAIVAYQMALHDDDNSSSLVKNNSTILVSIVVRLCFVSRRIRILLLQLLVPVLCLWCLSSGSRV